MTNAPRIIPLSLPDWLRGLPWLLLIEIIYLVPYGNPAAGGLAKKYIWDESAVSHNYPISYLARQEVREGFFPLWNHMTGMGLPLLADPQNETALPWNVFKYLLPFPLGYNLYFACRLLIILAGCFALGRSLGARRSGAIILAAVFSFTGFISFLMNGCLSSVFLLPWCVFAFHRLAREPVLKWTLLLALSFGLALLGGNPQWPIHALVIGFGLYLAALLGQKEKFTIGRWLMLPALGVTLGALLAAPQILPFLELAPRLLTHHGANYGLLHLDPRGLISTLTPFWSPAVFAMTGRDMGGLDAYIATRLDPQTWSEMTMPLPFEHIGFAGVFGVILVLFTMRRQKLESVYFALVALVSLGVAFGIFPFNLIGRIPPFTVIGNFRYSCFTAAFAGACCAALTLPELHLARMKKRIAPALAILLFILLTGMALVASQAGLPLSASLITLPTIGAIFTFLILAALSLKRPHWLVLFAVLEMLAYDRITDRPLFPHPLTSKNSQIEPACPGRDPAYRHTAIGKNFRPNLGILSGASDIRSFEPFLLRSYAQWIMKSNKWDDKTTMTHFLENYFLALGPDALLLPEAAKASVKWLQYDKDQPRDAISFFDHDIFAPAASFVRPDANQQTWFQHAPSRVSFFSTGFVEVRFSGSVGITEDAMESGGGDGVTALIFSIGTMGEFVENLHYARHLDPNRPDFPNRPLDFEVTAPQRPHAHYAVVEWDPFFKLSAVMLPGPLDDRRRDFGMWYDWHGSEERKIFSQVWRPFSSSPSAVCFENKYALPRLRFFGQPDTDKDIDGGGNRISFAGVDNDGYISDNYYRVYGKPEAIKQVEWGSNRISARVEWDTDGTIVLADNYYPGWKVYVDGKETRINRAEKIFRSIPVLAGSHEVLFRYEPLPFRVGLWAGLAGWSLLAVVIFFTARPRRESPPGRGRE